MNGMKRAWLVVLLIAACGGKAKPAPVAAGSGAAPERACHEDRDEGGDAMFALTTCTQERADGGITITLVRDGKDVWTENADEYFATHVAMGEGLDLVQVMFRTGEKDWVVELNMLPDSMRETNRFIDSGD
jgi:hypothetical protein